MFSLVNTSVFSMSTFPDESSNTCDTVLFKDVIFPHFKKKLTLKSDPKCGIN